MVSTLGRGGTRPTRLTGEDRVSRSVDRRLRPARHAEQGAAIAVRLAILPADGPTGAYLADSGPVPW
jgi:hypothetical protein